MDQPKAAQEISRRDDHEVHRAPLKPMNNEYPQVGRRFLKFVGLDRPPPARPQTFLKSWRHVGDQEVFREFDLKGCRVLVSAIRDQQVDSCIPRRNPQVRVRDAPLDL
jgi:hypothetical protein